MLKTEKHVKPHNKNRIRNVEKIKLNKQKVKTKMWKTLLRPTTQFLQQINSKEKK